MAWNKDQCLPAQNFQHLYRIGSFHSIRKGILQLAGMDCFAEKRKPSLETFCFSNYFLIISSLILLSFVLLFPYLYNSFP